MYLIVVSDVLCVTVVQGQNDWGVTYTSDKICALKGSTVDLNCTYSYPSDNTLVKTFWHNTDMNDLATFQEYRGRVEYICENYHCTLRITNLTDSDAKLYRFRIITDTNQYSGRYISLTITGNINIYHFCFKCRKTSLLMPQ